MENGKQEVVRKHKSEENVGVFLKEKPARILIDAKTEGKPKYTTQLSKETDCTYSHAIKILETFREMGLVEFEKTGRIKSIRLTETGWDIAHDLEAIMRKLERLGPVKSESKQPGEKENTQK